MSGDTGQTDWKPGRGDYGADHASDMIELIEELNCSLGCTKAGSRVIRAEFGPGGNCSVLLAVFLGPDDVGIPELDPRPEGPHCRAREAPPAPEPRGPRPRRPPPGMSPLFSDGDPT